MAKKQVEQFKVTLTLRDGETDHNREDIIKLLDSLIDHGVNDLELEDSFQEEALDDLISINIV